MGRLFGWIVAGAGLVALVLAGTWLGQAEESAAAEARPGFVLPVTLTTVERGDLHPRVPLSGTVRAARRARLGFDASGLITGIEVGEADRVAAGQVLAHLDRGDEENELAAAEAALALAEREHELLLAGERDEDKRRLEAELEAATAEAELAKIELERAGKLLQERIVSQSMEDRLVATWRAADKRRVAADEEYRRALAGARPEDVAIAVARVTQARTRVETARHQLRKTQLIAPWDGSVVTRHLSTGDHVSAGDPVFELADVQNLEIHVEVPARYAPYLGESTRVEVTLWRDPEFRIERPLDAIIPAADERARSFRAIVRPTPEEDPRQRLKPGMFANVELLMEPVRDALVLPSDCVLAQAGGTYFVRAVPAPEQPADGPTGLVADFVPVRVLATADGMTAVETLGPPIAPGDQVVLVGADNAFPGAALMPRSPASEPEPTAEAPTASAEGDVGEPQSEEAGQQ